MALPTGPRPYVVTESGDAEDAPAGAVPIKLFGADSAAAVTASLQAIPGYDAAQLQVLGHAENGEIRWSNPNG